MPYELVPIHDITSGSPEIFGANPAMKLPTLRTSDGRLIFGSENICRVLHGLSRGDRVVIWPEDLEDDLSRNAHELVRHAMAAQVQLAFGVAINHLPAENAYFVKARAGLEGSLRWLDEQLGAVMNRLPPRDLSLLEVMLFCLVEHLSFRPSVSLEPYARLREWTKQYGRRDSAIRTEYRFDATRA